MEHTVATPFTSANTLQSLPAEIISSIADHLRSLPHVREDYTPRLASVCSCSQVTPLKFAKAQLQSLGHYQYEALALGMTCRRLREIVFLERLGRVVSVPLCREASTDSARMPERLRNHVRDPKIRELELYIGNKSTGIVDSGGEPHELFSAIVEETGDLLAHLHLPFLESLFLRIDINEVIPDEPYDWSALDLLAKNITVEKWAKTLKRVDLVISFDLDEEPHAEVLEGIYLVEDLLAHVVCHGAVEARITLNFFFRPENYRSGVVRRLHPSRLRQHNLGNVDVDFLVVEKKMRDTTSHLESFEALERAEVRVTASTSNGWQHHERTLASVSYTKPDGDVTPSTTDDDSSDVTLTRNTQGAQEICEIITDIVHQNGVGVPRAEMQARAEWMALRGMVEQSRVTGREVDWWS